MKVKPPSPPMSHPAEESIGSEAKALAPLSAGKVVLAYLCSVTAATLTFTLIEVGIAASRDLAGAHLSFVAAPFVACLFWLVALVTALLPVAITFTVARWVGIRSIIYYLPCGAVTGILLTPIFVWYGNAYGMPDETFLGSWLIDAPMFVASGACAAAVFWYKVGRHVRSAPQG